MTPDPVAAAREDCARYRNDYIALLRSLDAYAEAVARAEREKAAQVCDLYAEQKVDVATRTTLNPDPYVDQADAATDCAARIRALT